MWGISSERAQVFLGVNAADIYDLRRARNGVGRRHGGPGVRNDDGVATSDGVTVAIERGPFLGVQFHPEKSAAAGLNFLKQCLSRA